MREFDRGWNTIGSTSTFPISFSHFAVRVSVAPATSVISIARSSGGVGALIRVCRTPNRFRSSVVDVRLA